MCSRNQEKGLAWIRTNLSGAAHVPELAGNPGPGEKQVEELIKAFKRAEKITNPLRARS